MSTPGFTVVVVLHNSERHLRRLLDSIEHHLSTALPEIVVVDSGSSDHAAELAEARGARVLRTANIGFGAANNAGVAMASHAVCALLNPDIALLDSGLHRLVELARTRQALFVPRLRDDHGAVERSAHPVPGRLGGLLPAVIHPRALPRAARLRVDPWRATRPRTVGWAIAACVVARTSLLRALGPFDPDAFLFYEDMDLCLRARAAGAPTELRPEVELLHTGRHSTDPAFGGEPLELLAARRREVIRSALGPRASLLDDLSQATTFATRAIARRAIGRDARREFAQLRAVIRPDRGAARQ